MANLSVQLPDSLHWQDGEVRFVGHRIGLYHVLTFYRDGYSPEMLIGQYPTLTLLQIHRAIVFYLENRDAVDRYLDEYSAELTRLEENHRSTVDWDSLRARFEAMQQAELASTGPN